MNNPGQTEKPIFSQLTLQYGPLDVLGRTILIAEQLCNKAGVWLSLATPQEVLAINKANSKTWLPLLRQFDHNFNPLTSQNSLFIVGRNRRGEAVACQAARFYDWTGTNFAAEAESLRLFYANPASMRLPNEQCVVTSNAARGTTGRVVFSGGAWYRPDHRGLGLVEWLPRIARAYARGVWDTRNTVTIMSELNVNKGVFPRNGYRNMEWSVEMFNCGLGDLRCSFMWSKDDEMLDDLRKFLASQAVNGGAASVAAGNE